MQVAPPQGAEPLSLNPGCFGCGPENPHGLGLQPYRLQDGTVWAVWTPDQRHQGYPRISHGGIVSSVLDEMMGYAIRAAEHPHHATSRMNLTFRRPAFLGAPHRVTARVEEKRGRVLQVSADLYRYVDGDDTGAYIAGARADFIRLKAETLQEFAGGSFERTAPRG